MNYDWVILNLYYEIHDLGLLTVDMTVVTISATIITLQVKITIFFFVLRFIMLIEYKESEEFNKNFIS